MSIWELNNIIEALGITSGVYALILALSLGLFYILLNRAIKNSYAKSLERYKIEHKKYIDILFRDETVRASVMSSTIVDNDKERMRIYKRVRSLYFKIQGSSGNIKGEKDDSKRREMVDKLYEEVKEVKKDIIENMVCLGNDLMDYLYETQDGLTENLRTFYSRGRNEYDRDQSTEALERATNWIKKNMKPDLTLNDVDLPEDLTKELGEKKIKMIRKQLKAD